MQHWAGGRVEYFENRYFRSNHTYSELMLLPEFYKRFSDYDFMLVYQLDAFVFSDRLNEFCMLGYDYIGAPMKRWEENWSAVGCMIGNGGFSLRKIQSMVRVLEDKEAIFRKKPACWKENRFLLWEDVFFAFCSTLPELDFHVPDFHTALNFAVGTDISHVYAKMPEWMPFGCHAWDWQDYWFWKPLVESYGYALPKPKGDAARSMRQILVERYLGRRILRASEHHKKVVSDELMKIWPEEPTQIVLWGWGVYGRIAKRIFQMIGQDISLIFDRGVNQETSIEGTKVVPPDIDKVWEQGLYVVVTTRKYEDEICENLMGYGMIEGKNYGRISVLMDQLLKLYLRSFVAVE